VIFKILVVLVCIAMLVASCLLPEGGKYEITRGGWQYLALFVMMLTLILTKVVPDWGAALISCVFLILFEITNFSGAFSGFSNSTAWLTLSFYMLCTGLTNSGFLKRLALHMLKIFPRSYLGQVAAFLSTVAVLCPLIPSATAKAGILSPLACEIGEQSGYERHSKPVIGLWSIAAVGCFYLSCAFISGSAQCAVMMGFMGITVTWGQWALAALPWFITGLVLLFLFCAIFCAPKDDRGKQLPTDFFDKKIESLGKPGSKEIYGAVVLAIDVIFWLTESLHGIPALYVIIISDAVLAAGGLLSPQEVSSKGNWTLVIFIATLLGFAGFMSTTGLSSVVSQLLGPIVSPIISNPYIFIPCICILSIVLRYAIVSQLCAMTILNAIFLPLLPAHGISVFVFVFSSFLSGGHWNVPYANPLMMGVVGFAGEDHITYQDAKYASYVFNIICVVGCTVSVPLWQRMGLC